jgi:uncharacterized RDD family membrane protein YckC
MTPSEHSGLGVAGRVLLSPARLGARLSRKQLESALEDVLATPELARLVDAALAGPLAEQLARSLVEHRVIERMGDELVRSGELERLVNDIVESPRTAEMIDQVLSGPIVEQAIRRVVTGPELQDVLMDQSRTWSHQLLGAVRGWAHGVDDRLERTVRRGGHAKRGYAGAATRAVALALDVLLVNLLVSSVTGVLAIISSFFGGLHPTWLAAALLSVGYVLVDVGYFVLFWSAVGQTPGMRLLGLRVSGANGAQLSAGRSIVRFVGLVLAVIPLFAGFIPVLFDARRRALPDYLAGSVVVYD